MCNLRSQKGVSQEDSKKNDYGSFVSDTDELNMSERERNETLLYYTSRMKLANQKRDKWLLQFENEQSLPEVNREPNESQWEK